MIRGKKDLGKANPRFASPTVARQINFNKRTLDRLFYAWRFGLLDDGHLQKLLGGYSRHVHRELELTKAGLIYHPEAQVPLRSMCNDITWITALTGKGAEALASKGHRIDPTTHKERYRRHKAFNSLLHDLSRSDYLVALDCAVKATLVGNEAEFPENSKNSPNEVGEAGEVCEVGICHQDEIFNKPYTETIAFTSMVEWKRQHRPVIVEPDGLFSLTIENLPDDRAQKYFALEIDQDTESNVRYKKFWQYKSIIKTMISYAEAHQRGIVDDKLGLSNLRTIFVTTTQKHIRHILKDAATHYIASGYPPNLCLFVSWEQLETEGIDPLNANYVNAAGNRCRLGD